MGLFDFLKGTSKTDISISNRKIVSNSDFEYSVDGFITIGKLHFFGRYSSSINGQYIIAWADHDVQSRTSGFRYEGMGIYVLLHKGKIKLQGKLERPNDGKVANNGISIINDWMFGEGLKGIFYAFDSDGNQLLKHKCEANLGNNGLSNDGNYAVVQTCNNQEGDDGNKLFFFDLTEKKLKWKHAPETGWAKEYRFDTSEKLLYQIHDEKRMYRYTFDGDFIDYEKYEKDRIEFGNGYVLLEVAEEKKKQLDDANADLQSYDEIINLLNRALQDNVSDNRQARIHRFLGETLHTQGKDDEAIKHLDIALELDPKVGAKRLLKQIQKDV